MGEIAKQRRAPNGGGRERVALGGNNVRDNRPDNARAPENGRLDKRDGGCVCIRAKRDHLYERERA